MTQDELDIWGRRAVACKQWRWMPGMLALDGWRVVGETDASRIWCRDEAISRVSKCNPSKDTPDLSDPATVGCLLSLVREAWGDPTLHVVAEDCSSGTLWCVRVSKPWAAKYTSLPRFSLDSEVKALLTALEAAP